MGLIAKIALRNIQRHKGKSLIIGAILFLGALIMTVGNGVVSGMEKGLAKNIVNGFTGDVIIVSDKQQGDNVLIEMMGRAIEPIHNYPEIKEVLERQEYVSRFLPAGKNGAMILNDDGGSPGFAYLLGVDFDDYARMFPENLRTVEGSLMSGSGPGLLLPTGARKEFFDYTSIWFVPEGASIDTANLTPEAKKADRTTLSVKDSVVFMGMNSDNSTHDIRLGIKGVVKYRALNTIWGHFTLVDIESYRKCLGYFSAAETNVPLTEKQQTLLAVDDSDLDALFGEHSILVPDNNAPAAGVPAPASVSGTAPTESSVDLESGTYNLVFTLLNDGTTPEEGARRLNRALSEANVGARAVTWRKAAGVIGSMSTLIKGSLFTFVMFLFLVAIIIIVNTLSMAALERTSEIGMMRAVGARRGFISRMFLGETAVLSFLFGGAGIITGIVVVNILPLFTITSDNDMVQLLFGGDTFHPVLSLPDIGLAVLQLAVVTGIAVIYPLLVARNITPLDAISRD